MSRGIQIDYETGDRIAICVMKEQLDYLLKEQEWFESNDDARKELEEQWGHKMYVHPEDYAKNGREYIPALKLMIEYFGGVLY